MNEGTARHRAVASVGRHTFALKVDWATSRVPGTPEKRQRRRREVADNQARAERGQNAAPFIIGEPPRQRAREHGNLWCKNQGDEHHDEATG